MVAAAAAVVVAVMMVVVVAVVVAVVVLLDAAGVDAGVDAVLLNEHVNTIVAVDLLWLLNGIQMMAVADSLLAKNSEIGENIL